MNRRRFLKSGSLWLPTLFSISHGLAQSTFIGEQYNGLLNGLVAYWKLDEVSGTSYADATGNGWTGTKQNTVTPGSGIINGGQGFLAASTSAISVSVNIDTRNSAGPFSFQIWWNTGGTGGGEALLGEWGTRNDWILFNFAGNTLRLRSNDDTATTTDTGSQVVTINTWHHLVGVWDGVHTTLYLDTVASTQGTPINIRRGGGSFVIGNYQGFTDSSQGEIDEVAYWNVALLPYHVTKLYNNGNALAFGSFTR